MAWGYRSAGLIAAALVVGVLVAAAALANASEQGTVWLCRPGVTPDPCTSSLDATIVTAQGTHTVSGSKPTTSNAFDCFYVYPTVSLQQGPNANLTIGGAETDAAIAQASRFSQVCQVYAPMYRQVTLTYLESHPSLDFPASVTATAYDSIRAGFEDFVEHASDGRPFVVIGHSQGSAMLILLLKRLVDDVPALRDRLVASIILGGNVEVPTGHLAGGTFEHIPLCDKLGETGCVIAYSSFPSTPPQGSLFGRPGQGVSLQSDQQGSAGLQVACVNPAALAGGSATLEPFFPSLSAATTPWVSYPGLYTARCERASGASWLDVTKATGASDHRPVVTEQAGPLWGYHGDDVNLALGNLVADVAAAEAGWSNSHS